jgi:virginiamycin B lyase
MRTLILLSIPLVVVAPPAGAQATPEVDLREWAVEWGGRSRDPYVGPEGKVWFVGQQGNYVAYFDPATESFRRYEIEAGTHPHTVIVDDDGFAWYAGNRNGRIGRIDPASGEARIFTMPDERLDPHTMAFDGQGNIWFTMQGGNRIGRISMETGEVDLVIPNDQPSNPYGIVLDGDGVPWVSLFRTNTVARVDPVTLEVTRFEKADEASRSRRIEVTPDGMVWYVDEPRGHLGRIDPRTGDTAEWATPGGPGSRPYALTKDDQGRLWFSETGPVKQLVGFDPNSETFFSVNAVSHTIRHMNFDARTGAMWFGTDANNIGRLIVRGIGVSGN